MSLKYEPASEPLHISVALPAEDRMRPQRVNKSSFSIALICTTSHRMPAGASANQGSETGDLISEGVRVGKWGSTLGDGTDSWFWGLEFEQPLDRNVQWFRGGLVFEAHRLVYHPA